MIRRPHVFLRPRQQGARLGVVFLVLATLFCLVAGPAVASEPPETPSSTEGGAAEDGAVTKTLKWATASEVDNFGYDVYRAEHPDGPFERRTSEPVLGAGTTDEPSYYEWVDEGLDPAKDYYYYVESISIHDERERFTPIIKVEAKTPSGANVASEDAASEDAGGDG